MSNPLDPIVSALTGWDEMQMQINRIATAAVSLPWKKRLTEWERRFATDIADRLDQFGTPLVIDGKTVINRHIRLSSAQVDQINRIAAKVADCPSL